MFLLLMIFIRQIIYYLYIYIDRIAPCKMRFAPRNINEAINFHRKYNLNKK